MKREALEGTLEEVGNGVGLVEFDEQLSLVCGVFSRDGELLV